MTTRKSHSLHQSRLYKVKSPAQLAEVLTLKKSEAQQLLKSAENYIRFTTHSGRDVQWPKPVMRRAHKRAADLLARVTTPEFLHSAIKGRSYLTNAARHPSAYPTVKIDLRKFFQSVRAAAVFHFFRDKMMCAPDVSAVLTKILTVDGHLPTGSSVSPILSYFAYADMFDELSDLATSHGCTMTCYIDDMTFTGHGATRKLIYDVKKIVSRYRLWAHKTKVFKAGQPKVVTGVAITKSGQKLPNKRQKAINQDLQYLATAVSDKEKVEILRRLVGRAYEAAQIDPSWRKKAAALAVQKKHLERRLSESAG